MRTELGRTFWRETASIAPGGCSSEVSQVTLYSCRNNPRALFTSESSGFLELLSQFPGRWQARVLRKGYLLTYPIKLLNWPEAGVF